MNSPFVQQHNVFVTEIKTNESQLFDIVLTPNVLNMAELELRKVVEIVSPVEQIAYQLQLSLVMFCYAKLFRKFERIDADLQNVWVTALGLVEQLVVKELVKGKFAHDERFVVDGAAWHLLRIH